MFTKYDMRSQLKDIDMRFDDMVDSWLENDVLPILQSQGKSTAVKIPANFPTTVLHNALVERGYAFDIDHKELTIKFKWG